MWPNPALRVGGASTAVSSSVSSSTRTPPLHSLADHRSFDFLHSLPRSRSCSTRGRSRRRCERSAYGRSGLSRPYSSSQASRRRSMVSRGRSHLLLSLQPTLISPAVVTAAAIVSRTINSQSLPVRLSCCRCSRRRTSPQSLSGITASATTLIPTVDGRRVPFSASSVSSSLPSFRCWSEIARFRSVGRSGSALQIGSKRDARLWQESCS